MKLKMNQMKHICFGKKTYFCFETVRKTEKHITVFHFNLLKMVDNRIESITV